MSSQVMTPRVIPSLPTPCNTLNKPAICGASWLAGLSLRLSFRLSFYGPNPHTTVQYFPWLPFQEVKIGQLLAVFTAGPCTTQTDSHPLTFRRRRAYLFLLHTWSAAESEQPFLQGRSPHRVKSSRNRAPQPFSGEHRVRKQAKQSPTTITAPTVSQRAHLLLQESGQRLKNPNYYFSRTRNGSRTRERGRALDIEQDADEPPRTTHEGSTENLPVLPVPVLRPPSTLILSPLEF